MGQGIAKAFAQVEGNTVALCDIKQEWAENGLAKIKKAAGYEKLVAKGKMTQEKADRLYRRRHHPGSEGGSVRRLRSGR